MPVIPLQVLSEFSLLPHTATISNLVARAAELKLPALALTDLGNLHGTVAFYQACRDRGVQPIIGCVVPVVLPGRSRPVAVTVLTESPKGFNNLMRLSSELNREGQSRHLPWQAMRAHREGLVAVVSSSRATARACQSVFVEGSVYLGVTPSDFIDLTRRAGVMRGLGAVPRLALFTVERLGDLSAHANWHCDDPAWIDLCAATAQVASRCQYRFAFRVPTLPTFSTPDGERGHDYLVSLAWAGLARCGRAEAPEYRLRLGQELEVAQHMDFSEHFLLVADYVGWARRAGIPIGPGYGEATSSLLCYVLDITRVDPLGFGLYSEVLFSCDRIRPPDIAVAVGGERLDELRAYLVERWGSDRVARVAEVVRDPPASALQAAGTELRVPQSRLTRAVQQVEAMAANWPGEKPSLSQILAGSPGLEDHLPQVGVWQLACSLDGQVAHVQADAGSLALSGSPLLDLVPLMTTVRDGTCTQFDKQDADMCGVTILQLPALEHLDHLQRCVRRIDAQRAVAGLPPIDLDAVPPNDRATADLLCRADTHGVYLLESVDVQALLRCLQPKCLGDLVVLQALHRLGPAETSLTRQYLALKNGQAVEPPPNPLLAELFSDTCGEALFFEQILAVAVRFAGFTPGMAELMARAFQRRKSAEVFKWQEEFVRQAELRGCDAARAGRVVTVLAEVAGQVASKAHCVALATLQWQLAWLRAHWREEFDGSCGPRG